MLEAEDWNKNTDELPNPSKDLILWIPFTSMDIPHLLAVGDYSLHIADESETLPIWPLYYWQYLEKPKVVKEN